MHMTVAFDGPVVLETRLEGLRLKARGKVRDIYELGESLLIVATDRISAFDVVLPDGIPGKGAVLTQLSAFWFRWLSQYEDILWNHFISADAADFPASCQPHRAMLEGRSILGRKAAPLPVECIVRGYLSGSGWLDYQRTGEICGQPLPKGLVESQKLPEPLFTPSTKAERGLHDVNIPFAAVAQTRAGARGASRRSSEGPPAPMAAAGEPSPTFLASTAALLPDWVRRTTGVWVGAAKMLAVGLAMGFSAQGQALAAIDFNAL